MSRLIFGYIVRLYLQYVLVIFPVILIVFLIADFGDRAKAFVDHPWTDIALLYWNKALVAAQQMGPAVLLLAAGATVSTLRKRGELTALNSLSFSPATLYVPIGLCALVASVVLVVFDEWKVTKASALVDEISTTRFDRWGDWRFHFEPKRWFRHGDRIFVLRGGGAEDGFNDVTIFTLSQDFQLSSRIDARHMKYVNGEHWELTGVVERKFDANQRSTVRSIYREELALGVSKNAFRIRAGRPEQMRARELISQIKARRDVGLSTQLFALTLHNRFAYPLMGFAAALLATGLALRPGRRGHLTVALLEGFAVAMVLWGLMVVGKALVFGEHISPPTAAWGPLVVLAVLAVALWFKHEGVKWPRQ